MPTPETTDAPSAEDEPSLERRSAVGIAWLTGEAGVIAITQIGYTAVISRLLDPASFGVIAAAGLLIRLVGVLSRNGLQNAVVQARHLTRSQIDSAFAFGAMVGAGSSLVLVLAAPLVRIISDHPNSVSVTRVVALTAFFSSLGAVSEGLIRRRFDFRSLATIGMSAQATGFAIGIISAVAGAGVWSLAFAALSQSSMAATLLVIKAGHRPQLSHRLGDGRALIRFGMGSSVIGYLEFIGSSLDTISVGRWVGASGLGQYSRATMLVQLPAGQAAGIIGRVLLASMSSIRHQRERLTNLFVQTMSVYAVAMMTIAAAVSVSAPAAVRVLLGSGWDPAIQVLPMVAVGATLTLVAQPPGTLAEAIGALRFKMAATLTQVVVVAAGVVYGSMTGRGLLWFAGSWVASEVVRWLAYIVFARQVIKVPTRVLGRLYCEAAIVATTFSAPLFLTVRVLALPDVEALVGGLLGGLALTAAALLPLRSKIAWIAAAQALAKAGRG